MAAAVRPRRRSRDSSSSATSTDVTYVRLTLALDSIRGAKPGSYFVRWTRGTDSKKSAARTLNSDSSQFGETVSMYARVKRDGGQLVSADDAPDLNSRLALVRLAPGTSGKTAVEETEAVAGIDIGHLLQTMADSGKKNTRTAVQFTDGSSGELTVTSKALGEGTLSSLGGVQGTDSYGNSSHVDSEVANMRNALRLRADQIDTLTNRTEQHALKVDSGTASSDEVRALKERVHQLEVHNTAVEKQRIDAQRKVDAHVAHAAKIKSTYNQLAGWYNNLRQEYAELQKRSKSQSGSFSEGPSDGVARQLSGTTNVSDDDFEKLREERDALKEALEKEKERQSLDDKRNSDLLETKAKALDDLRMQWDSTRSDILAAEEHAADQRRASELAKRELEDTKALLEDARSALASAQAKHRREAEQLEEEKVAAIEEARRQGAAESQESAATELENVEQKHAEVVSKLADNQSEKEAEIRKLNSELESMKTETQKLADEIGALKFAKTSADIAHKEEIDKLVTETDEVRKKAFDDAFKQKDEEIAALKSKHQKKVESLEIEMEEEMEKEVAVSQQKASEIADLEDENGLLRAELDKVSSEAERRADDMAEELAKLREKMDLVESQNRDLENEKANLSREKAAIEETSRQVHEDRQGSTARITELQSEISNLKKNLAAKEKETVKSIRLLEDFEAENDEQRLLVARLRRERDEARQELVEEKQTNKDGEREQRRLRDDVAKAEDAHKAEIDHLKEERDQSIRELFKVRKALNAELKQVKRERTTISEELEELKSSKALLDSNIAQRDEEIAKTRNEVVSAKEEAKLAKAEIKERESKLSEDRKAFESEFQESFTKLQSELEATKQKLDSTKKDLNNAMEALNAGKESSFAEAAELRDIISKLQAGESTQKLAIDELEERLSAERREKEKILVELGDGNAKMKVIQDREEEVQRLLATELAKSAALSGELMSLKESMTAVESSSSSTEQHLVHAQRELAEVRAQKEALVSDLSSVSTAADAAAERAAETEAKLSSELNDSLEKTSELREEVRSLRLKNVELETRSKSLDKSSVEAESRARESVRELEVSKTEVANLRNEVALLQSKIHQYSSSVNNADELVLNLRKELKAAEGEKIASETELRAANERLRSVENSAEERASAVTRLETLMREKEATLEKIEREKRDALAAAEELRDVADTSRSELEEQVMSGRMLDENLKRARAEVEKLTEDLTAERKARSRKEEEVELSSNELQELKSKTEKLKEEHEQELRSKSKELKEMQHDLVEKDSTAKSLQSAIYDLEAKIELTDKEYGKVRDQLDKLNSDTKQRETESDEIRDKYLAVKQRLADESVEKAELQEELKATVDEKSQLEDEVREMQDRVSTLQEAQRTYQKDKRDQKRSSTLQSELMGQRARAEKAEAQIAQLRRMNKELSVKLSTTHESGDLSRDQTLQLLIEARINYASAQTQIDQLRNDLIAARRTAGNSSFEKKSSSRK